MKFGLPVWPIGLLPRSFPTRTKPNFHSTWARRRPSRRPSRCPDSPSLPSNVSMSLKCCWPDNEDRFNESEWTCNLKSSKNILWHDAMSADLYFTCYMSFKFIESVLYLIVNTPSCTTPHRAASTKKSLFKTNDLRRKELNGNNVIMPQHTKVRSRQDWFLIKGNSKEKTHKAG